MEIQPNIRKCEVCLVDATCLCFECMSYFCDTCFKSSHNNEARKSHKKEKIDYYVPIDVKCPEHKLIPMNLFCLDEKSNLNTILFLIFYSTLLRLLSLYESS